MILKALNESRKENKHISVADPGFPEGGRAPIRGGMDFPRGCFLVKMYAKTKELGPIGEGVHLARPPRYANAFYRIHCHYINRNYLISPNISTLSKKSIPSFWDQENILCLGLKCAKSTNCHLKQ